MSTEDDTELRDLVCQALEVNGCLSKIRAELRASIFLTLNENEDVQKKKPTLNSKLGIQQESSEGQLMFCLVREFLEYFDLDFTISVFEPESCLGSGYCYNGRYKTVEDLGMPQMNSGFDGPLLLQLMKLAKAPSTTAIDINLNTVQENTSSSEYKSKQSDVENLKTDVPCLSQSDLAEIEAPLYKDPNGTFDVNSPIYELFRKKKYEKLNTHNTKKEPNAEASDTELSNLSIAEYSSNSDPSETHQVKEFLDADFSPPIVKDIKPPTSPEKAKISPPKADKFKAKSSLSSLADLPPLPANKNRTDSVLLPSLYSKEFKEKSNLNLKEIDKFFDVDSDTLDNYEEDIICGSEPDLLLNLHEEMQLSGSTSSESTRSLSPKVKTPQSIAALIKSTPSPPSSVKFNTVRSDTNSPQNNAPTQRVDNSSPQISDNEECVSIAEELTVSNTSIDDFQLNT